MHPLLVNERKLVDMMVMKMTKLERRNYFSYRQGEGFTPTGFDQMETCAELHRKGWLAVAPDLAEPNRPMFLHGEAWQRFNVSDWDEIEERRVEEKRGEVAGSW